MHIWPPADFCGFGLEHVVPIHLIFEPCPLSANVRWWWNDYSSLHLPVLDHTDVDHCGLCLNYLHQTRWFSWTWSATNVKTILPKTRKQFSCHALSDGIVPIHGAIVSGYLRCFRPSIDLEEKNMSEMFQFLHLALHFLASTAPLTIFKWQNFNM